MSFFVDRGSVELSNHFKLIVQNIKSNQNMILEKETESEAKDASEAAPKKTGEMARKIYNTKKDENTHSVVADKFYTKFQEYGTFRIMAKEFLTNSEKQHTPIILQKLNEDLARQIKQTLSGGL